MKIGYCDMVGDLFHYGHVNYLKNAKEQCDYLIVGIHSNKTVESYKRTPVLNMEQRIKVIECCKYIDKIIPEAPLTITEEYIKSNNIDNIYIPSNRTEEEIKLMCLYPYRMNMIKKIKYTEEISTSYIINHIVQNYS